MVFKKIIFTRTNYDIEKRSSVKLRLFLPGRPSSKSHFPFILASMARPGRNNHTQHGTGASWQK